MKTLKVYKDSALVIHQLRGVNRAFRKDHEVPVYCQEIEEIDGKPWYYYIMRYVKDKEYPPDIAENNKRILRRLTMGYFLNGDVLYKRSSNMTLLRCVDTKEAEDI
ncbi:hypothetical protein CR513_17318, partial [Mucuna pruriens]